MPVARQRILLPPGSYTGALSGIARGDLWTGDAIQTLEKTYAEHLGVAATIAVPSARGGLLFLIEAAGLGPGDEVLCSAFGYPVVPHLFASAGCDLRFVDIETRTLGMDPEALERVISDRTKAVVVTHLYGVPCRIGEIEQIARAHGALLIEDCAHCYSASSGGRLTGSFGDYGYFSFETSKMVNTMGGGMVTAQSPEGAERIRERLAQEPRKDFSWLAKRLLRTTFEATVTHPLPFALGVYPALRLTSGKNETAKKDGPTEDDNRFASGYHSDAVSLRGRLGQYTNYQAKLGARQVQRLQPQLERRVTNATRLIERLRDRLPMQQTAHDDDTADYMLVTALVERAPELAQALLVDGVDTKRLYMRNCAPLLRIEGSFPNAARADREVLHLPAYPQLSTATIDSVADRVERALDKVSG